MPLFKCSGCGCVENTACCYYWVRGDKPALCSACDPAIGKWHELFPKKAVDPSVYIEGADGFLAPPGGWR